MEYLIILMVFLLISLFLEKKYKLKLYDNREERIIISLTFLCMAILWDNFAIYRGHWSFNGTGLIGIRIGLMPIEEYLFAVIIPYFILTMHKVLSKKIK
jgi:lycopene cyclase domain-containing protein